MLCITLKVFAVYCTRLKYVSTSLEACHIRTEQRICEFSVRLTILKIFTHNGHLLSKTLKHRKIESFEGVVTGKTNTGIQNPVLTACFSSKPTIYSNRSIRRTFFCKHFWFQKFWVSILSLWDNQFVLLRNTLKVFAVYWMWWKCISTLLQPCHIYIE